MIGRALVCGAGGFIGHNLVKRLKSEGWYVEGIDLHIPEFEPVATNLFRVREDLAKYVIDTDFDRIYQLAADMGGAGFVFTGDNDADILTNSLSINLNLLKQLKNFKGTIFFSSSACVYPAGVEGKESDAYPADPPSDYGWEKLTSERLFQAYARNYGLDIKIARFHNTYGPNGVFEGGREKAPAAICRKVLRATNQIEIWGDGQQVRPFLYIDDLLDGIEALMSSNLTKPINLGPKQGVTINEMVDLVCSIAGKQLKKVYIDGPTGERVRNSFHDNRLGWTPKVSLKDGLTTTYEWIKTQDGKI